LIWNQDGKKNIISGASTILLGKALYDDCFFIGFGSCIFSTGFGVLYSFFFLGAWSVLDFLKDV